MRRIALTLAAACLFGLGCETHQTAVDPAVGRAEIDIQTSSREILAGDTVTFIARSYDTYGRNAKVKWTSTGGDVATEEEGRVARVKFTEPGTYSVRATLEVDGRDVQSDIVEVRVKPLT